MPEIQMPKLSDTMTEGTLVAWKKKRGDKVSAGEVIAEIETDKATMEWESPEDGTLSEIYVEEGGKVNVGEKIAFIGEEGEAAPKEEKKAQKETEKETAPPEAKLDKKTVEAGVSPATRPSRPPLEKQEGEEARVRASPVARRIAAEFGVDLARVSGTGPEGRVTETDVRAAAKSKSTATPAISSTTPPRKAPSGPLGG